MPEQLENNMESYLPERNTLVISSISSALRHPEPLVQRAALDFIVVHFKLHHHIFDHLALVELASAALEVSILRNH